MSIWDRLLNEGQRVVAIGGSDAHTFQYQIGMFRLTVFPYTSHFRAINTHGLIDHPLRGNYSDDSWSNLPSLKNGNAFIAIDHVLYARGFRLYAQAGGQLVRMGGEIPLGDYLFLRARLSAKARCRVIRNGIPMKKFPDSDSFDFPVLEKRIYRLECDRQFFLY